MGQTPLVRLARQIQGSPKGHLGIVACNDCDCPKFESFGGMKRTKNDLSDFIGLVRHEPGAAHVSA
ncbi:hypothetical protein XH94_35310, partial [Bradyrhizobium zhanjiangense]